jgi:hypothetical protein
LLFAETRGRRVTPNERVLVAGNSLELVWLHSFVTLNDGLPVSISGDDATVSARFLTALGKSSFLGGPSIHDSISASAIFRNCFPKFSPQTGATGAR